MSPHVTRWMMRILSGVAFGLVALAVPAAQNAPPIGGVTGTIALEGSMRKFYRAANTIVVATLDGVEHVYHFTADLVVHGGKGAGIDALEGLHEGTVVVVHYSAHGAESTAGEVDILGDDGLRMTEGSVIGFDRRRQQITVKYANGKTEVFRLTGRAAAEASPEVARAADETKVMIYYRDEHGRKVVHYFKQVPP